MEEQNRGEVIIYQTEDGLTKINVKMEDETVWLSQQQMAELFKTSRTNIVEHIKHIYEENELIENSTCRNFRQVRLEGKVSHEEAMKKANDEYRKYQENTISPVERAYLESLKSTEKEVKKSIRENKN